MGCEICPYFCAQKDDISKAEESVKNTQDCMATSKAVICKSCNSEAIVKLASVVGDSIVWELPGKCIVLQSKIIDLNS